MLVFQPDFLLPQKPLLPRKKASQLRPLQESNNANMSDAGQPQLASSWQAAHSERMADMLAGSQQQQCEAPVVETERPSLDAELRATGQHVALMHTQQLGATMARDAQDLLTGRALQIQASVFLLSL